MPEKVFSELDEVLHHLGDKQYGQTGKSLGDWVKRQAEQANKVDEVLSLVKELTGENTRRGRGMKDYRTMLTKKEGDK